MNYAWLLCAAAVCLSVVQAEDAKVVKEGDELPAVSAQDESGTTVNLTDFKGKSGLVLFFFPKAFTPGCTKETCGFRDESAKYKEKGYTIYGVSRDTPKMLGDFKAKYTAPYSFLSDPNSELAKTFGFAPGERSTAVIGKDGKVEKILKKVNPTTHYTELLKDLK